jgi:hypothetical protein
MNAMQKFRTKLAPAVTGVALAVVSGASFAGGGGLDTTEILATITDAQTKGIAIAVAVTVCLFLFFGAKLLRRAK